MAVMYTLAEIEIIREGGKRLAEIMSSLSKKIEPGVSTGDINGCAERLIREGTDLPAFLGYTPHGAHRPFPAALCISINEEVVHGIPNEHPRLLRHGDIVTIDCGLVHKGLVSDMALTVPVGKVDVIAAKLINAAREALSVAIDAARPGNTTGSIGALVEAVAKRYGFSTPHDLGGHGVGRSVHEEPFIPNFGKPGKGDNLLPGMILAIEPIVCEGRGEILLKEDGYTYVTKDGKRSAQFEHTVLVTEAGPEILTTI
jgi:methionyl aminopeptidase